MAGKHAKPEPAGEQKLVIVLDKGAGMSWKRDIYYAVEATFRPDGLSRIPEVGGGVVFNSAGFPTGHWKMEMAY